MRTFFKIILFASVVAVASIASAQKVSSLANTSTLTSNALYSVSARVGGSYVTKNISWGQMSNLLFQAYGALWTNAAAYQAFLATNGFVGASFTLNDVTNAASGVATNVAQAAVTNATRTPLVRTHPMRLPVNTLTKLQHGQGINVLWLGDSLVDVTYAVAKGYFATNLLATYGTNGWWGAGEYSGPAPWNPVYPVTGTFEKPSVSPYAPWLEESTFILTNGTSVLWNSRTGDGFFTADRAGLVYIRTNSPSPGTLTVAVVSDAGVTNVLDVINCSGTQTAIGTNYSFTPGRYEILMTASGGNGFFAAPGLWSSTSTGVRYGYLACTGINSYDAQSFWPAAVKAYQPDLLLLMDANDTTTGPSLLAFVRSLQTGAGAWTNTDIVFVAVNPTSADLGQQDAENLTADFSFRQNLFARTNLNTGFFDTKFVLGAGLGYQTLTNLGLQDTIHPANFALPNILGRKLLEDLELTRAAAAAVSGWNSDVRTNAANQWTGTQDFEGDVTFGGLNMDVTVGGGSGHFLVLTNSGISLNTANADLQISMVSRGGDAQPGTYWRYFATNNAWHFRQSQNEANDVLRVFYAGNQITVDSDAAFNYDGLHQAQFGTAASPYRFNGITVPTVKAAFTTNYTATIMDGVLFCTGTNQIITLPNCTTSPTGLMLTISAATTTGSALVTNATGAQTILGALKQSVTSTNRLTVVNDGANWW